MEAPPRAIEDAAAARSDAVRQHGIALERARCEAGRAWRQYDSVVPENRRAAGERERRWNEGLVAARTVENALDHAREASADIRMDDEEREACLQLGADLERAWNQEGVAAETRKRMLRAAPEEFVVRCEDCRIRLLPRGRGGDPTEAFVARRAKGRHRHATDAETGALITGPARRMPDMAIAALRNRLGRRTGEGDSGRKAGRLRLPNMRGVPPCCEGEGRERGEMTVTETAETPRVDCQRAVA